MSNTAQYGGALASFDTVLLVTGSTFSDNVAMQLYGGAVFLLGASIFRFEDTTFLSNQAQNQPGGALHLELAVLGSFIERSSFVDNSAILGGAISMFNNSGSQVIRNCTFFDNISRGDQGGALCSHWDEGLTVSHCAFVRNRATDGDSAGGLFSDGTTNVTTFVNNIADKDAVAAWISDAERFSCVAGSGRQHRASETVAAS